MKITRIIVQGESGQEMTLDTPPFNLNCNVGRCEISGSDASLVGFCDSCRLFVCADYWNDAAGQCDNCARLKSP